VKIKADFVTNSSSACYIVMIPPEFKLQDHLSMLEKGGIFNRFEHYTVGQDLELDVEKLTHFFEVLLQEGCMTEQLWERHGKLYMWVVLDLCQELKFTVADYDIPHEGNNIIVNVGIPNVLNKVKEIGGLVENKTGLRDK
jgi:hypothetical protein